MHIVKKYANRKMYDTTMKRYLTMDRLAELIKAGEEVSIIDNETGEDLTSNIVTQLLAREDTSTNMDGKVPAGVLMQVLRRGRGTLFGYGKKYIALFQSAMTMSLDEIEKLVNSLVKEKELSESEGRNLKDEIIGLANHLKSWIIDNIDQRISDALKVVNRSSKAQVSELAERLDALEERVTALEKSLEKPPV